ncbi:hypothetical protein [Mongoliibacter ruber]|uniref:Uncharacterized protein n=1 Tax=Mongoliibacter ruber TaxID=1750599 RepID=A0A2T0WHX5_9BACT|nr:hypothetical protein [Mongoliibacter ruber]PRY86318.1 hypothetical protein CLW00_109165 [Mongoliibacter ruber]
MKTFVLSLSIILVAFGINAQSMSVSASASSIEAEGCYGEYFQIFSERGAKAIPDGNHDVVISIIYNGESQCYFGKAKIENGKLVPPVQIQKEDLSYAPVSSLYRNLDQEWLDKQNTETLYDVVDGMSKTFYSEDQQAGRVFFYTFINDKPKSNRKAPSASALIKN